MSELVLEQILPKGWTLTKLDEICELIGGGTPSRQNPEYFNGDILWLTPTEIPKNKIIKIKDSKEKITELGLKKSSARIIPKNSVLLTSRASIGYVAIADMDVTTNQGFSSFVCSNSINNYFLAYWLFGKKDLLESKSTGTTFKEISKSKLKELEFKLPPINEQKRIVEKIESIFSKIEYSINTLKKIQNLLKDQNTVFFKELFLGNYSRDFECNSQHLEKRDYVGNLEKSFEKYAKESEKFIDLNIILKSELPSSWRWTNIGKISHVVRGASPRPSGSPKYFGGKIPWITVQNLTQDEHMYIYKVKKFLNEEGKKRSRYLESDTLMITNSGATLGVPKILKIGGCVNDGIVAMLEVDSPLKEYLYYYLKNLTRKLRMLNQGAAQPNLNTNIIKSIPVPMPTITEQKIILEKITNFIKYEKIISESIILTLEQLNTLKSTILKQAFEGKLVPQDPNDEPAEILLQKIKQEKQLIQKQKASRSTKNVK